MLTVFFDIVVGYFTAKYIRNMLFAIIAAAIFAILGAVTANVLVYFVGSGLFSLEDIIASITMGLIYHPVIAIVSFFYFKKRKIPMCKDGNSTPLGPHR